MRDKPINGKTEITLKLEDTEEKSPANLKTNILGSEWIIKFGNEETFPMLANCDGYTDSSIREIVVSDMSDCKDDIDHKKDLVEYSKRVIRHEIIHAFLMESGLETSSLPIDNWAGNEEMVDWMAIQAPKIFETFKELNVL